MFLMQMLSEGWVCSDIHQSKMNQSIILTVDRKFSIDIGYSVISTSGLCGTPLVWYTYTEVICEHVGRWLHIVASLSRHF
jgi:hypothetical protein